MTFRYHAHPGQEHRWTQMVNPPKCRICITCGRIEGPEGNVVRHGRTEEAPR